MIKSSLRNQILAFVLITFSISWLECYFIATSEHGIENPVRAFALMWTPGIVGLFLSWLFGWNFKDIGFRFGPWRYYLIAYAVPAVTAVLILFTLVATGLGEFEFNPKIIEKFGSLNHALVKVLLLSPTLGALMGFISGLGEEIGWRGFLHSKLMQLKVPHPFLITGLIWSVWHWPLILFSNYATSDYRFLSLALFTVMVTSLGIFIGYLREKSGSVFVAALVHGVHNLWIQGIYPAFLKKGPLDSYLGGESGVFNALFYTILAIYIYRKSMRTTFVELPSFQNGQSLES